MGANDHLPMGGTNLRPWAQREPKALLTWANIPANLIIDLIASASKIGAYVGFGQSTDGTALLLYVKNGRINERVAIESVKEAPTGIQWVTEHYLNAPG